MIFLPSLSLPPDHTPEELKKKAASTLGVRPEDILSISIKKRSIDARKRPDIVYSYALEVKTPHDSRVVKRCHSKNVTLIEKQKPAPLVSGAEVLSERPVIIGCGPAGLFCAWQLASLGYRPLILERGDSVEERTARVSRFWTGGSLDPESNVQFGEGGAGTFSDGKLNTMVKDVYGRGRKVLELFVRMGASPEILYDAKPHIGTDVLVDVVRNLRNEILRLGGEIRFRSCAKDFCIRDGRIREVILADGEHIPCGICVLAIGHSARDTFAILKEKGVPMEQKAFAVGLRIQHPQSIINAAMYGDPCRYSLPAAPYKLTAHAFDRGIYSFCMCPGGYVVNASSEEKRLAVNGMSYADRAGVNANSALIVTVGPADFGSGEVLAGIEFQRKLEERAYAAANGAVPVQKLCDFADNRVSHVLGEVTPMIKGAWETANLRTIMPEELNRALLAAFPSFERQIPGFSRPDALLAGVESRTSSPIRIVRDDRLESAVKGIYPCGEGAGYAGGITSAAMDGLKVAEEIIVRYAPGKE